MKSRISVFRERRGLSQTGLADMISISQKKMSQIENGIIDPSLAEISKLTAIFGCKFEELFVNEEEDKAMHKNALIKYIQREDHVDPNFTHLVFGEDGQSLTKLKNMNVEPGSYIFFHTSIGGAEYITAYFKIEKILIRGADDNEINALEVDAVKSSDEYFYIGDRKESKVLTIPLPLDKKLATELTSLNITEEYLGNFNGSELSAISSKTRPIRELSQNDVNTLIWKCERKG